MAPTNESKSGLKQPTPTPTILPAIFTHYNGLPPTTPNTPIIKDPIPRLQLLLQNLSAQHLSVRENMIFLISAQAEKLIQAANRELSLLPPESDTPPIQSVELRDSIEVMMGNIFARKKPELRTEDYLVRSSEIRPINPTNPASNLYLNTGSEQRTQYSIQNQISLDLRTLIEEGVRLIERYDTHAKETADYYRLQLQKKGVIVNNFGVPVTSSALPGYGSSTSNPNTTGNSIPGLNLGYRRGSGVGSPGGVLNTPGSGPNTGSRSVQQSPVGQTSPGNYGGGVGSGTAKVGILKNRQAGSPGEGEGRRWGR